MKNRRMLDLIGSVDQSYIDEADPTKAKKPKASKFKWTTILSAAACILLILNIAIFVPILAGGNETNPPSSSSDLNHIQGSGDLIQNGTSSSVDHIQNPDNNDEEDNKDEYTPDIQFLKNPSLLGALDSYFSNSNNNSNDLSDKVEEELENAGESFSPDNQSGSLASPDINDNQVQGISEADVAKRSDKHLFYLRGTTLYIYTISGKSSKTECILPLGGYYDKADELAKKLNFDQFEIDTDTTSWEMYLSSDYKTLNIIVQTNFAPGVTGIITLDVSNAPTVEFKDFKMFAGEYITSRVVNGEILLFTKYYVQKNYDKENPMAYIPFYTVDDECRYTDDIYFPNELSASTYITVTRLDQKRLRVLESVSYLSYSDEIYVSSENIFLIREIPVTGTFRENDWLLEEDRDYRIFEPIDSEIAIIGYKTPLFQNRGTVIIKGYVHNQYSLDEYEGILRVATTSYVEKDGEYDSSASLWCIDISEVKVVASVENFAPINEVVRSVRFDGTEGYVCTSLQKLVFSDPVFFFDLSDLENITYTDTGVIDGYSSSLINIGGGYLIGIGYGKTASTLKIEVYKEENGQVVSVCVEEFTSTRFSTDYKSYYVDRENHLIGLAISSYSKDTGSYEDSYLLLHFDGVYFDKVMALGVSHYSEGSVRSFYEKNYLYIVTDQEFMVYEVGRLSNLPFVTADGTSTGIAGETNQEGGSTARPTGPAWPSN